MTYIPVRFFEVVTSTNPARQMLSFAPENDRQVVQMHVHSSYLYRMTALYAIQVLTESLDVDMLSKVKNFFALFITL